MSSPTSPRTEPSRARTWSCCAMCARRPTARWWPPEACPRWTTCGPSPSWCLSVSRAPSSGRPCTRRRSPWKRPWRRWPSERRTTSHDRWALGGDLRVLPRGGTAERPGAGLRLHLGGGRRDRRGRPVRADGQRLRGRVRGAGAAGARPRRRRADAPVHHPRPGRGGGRTGSQGAVRHRPARRVHDHRLRLRGPESGRRGRGGGVPRGVLMTLAVRVIPCLDVDNGRVVKGVHFQNLRDGGDPVEMAKVDDTEGADKLTFLDITASSGNRETTYDVVRRTAEQVFIPLTVGGGVRSVDDVDRLLRAGADKVSLNTAAIERPELLREAAQRFGSQCIVLSVDARRAAGTESGFEVTTHGGRRGTGIDAIAWAQRGAELGVGEILLNSMDADGTKAGFDVEMLGAVRKAVSVPLIASGGAGDLGHFAPAVTAGADAVLAASVFHFGDLRIADVKQALRDAGHVVR